MLSRKFILAICCIFAGIGGAAAQKTFLAVDGTFNPASAGYNFVTDFGGVAGGVVNNFTTLRNACNGSGGSTLTIPAGSYAVTVPAATTLCTVPANTVFVGAGKGETILNLSVTDTTFANIFSLSNANVTFRDMTLNVTTNSTVSTTLFGLQASNIRFENCAFTGDAVEGVRVGGTATNLDTVNIVFSSTAITGSPVTITYTVGTGNTTAQIAQGLVNAVNANANLTTAGVTASLDGSFVKLNQSDTMTPQASYTTSVTGAATETLATGGSANLYLVVIGGTEADDFSMTNDDVTSFSYVILKANATTTTNKRFSFTGGYYNRNIHGAININSPSGFFEGLLVDGVKIGSVGINQTDSLPIALSNVSSARIVNNYLRGTYLNNAMHFEEAASQLVVGHNTVLMTTPTGLGAVYSGTCMYFVDNNIGGGGYKPVNDVSINGNVCAMLTANISGFGVWAANVSVAHLRHAVTGNVFTGFAGGIRYDTANGITIANNQFTNNAASGNGFVLGAGTTYAMVSNNVFRNYTTGGTTSATLSVIRDNYGYNPATGGAGAVTPGVSPWTYTAGSSPEDHFFKAGTITSLVQDGRTVATAFPVGGNCVTLHLEPNESYVLTYAVAPTIDKVIH